MLSVRKIRKICALLTTLFVLCQFMPYWQVEGEETTSVSINGYVWFPHHHEDLTASLSSQEEDYSITSMAWLTVCLMILCVVSIIVCLLKGESGMVGLLPIATGLIGIIGYLRTPALLAGTCWWLHLVLFVLMAAAGVWAIVAGVRGERAKA